MDTNIYGLKYAGLAWFGNIKKCLEAIGFVQYQVDPGVWYREEIDILFYVDDCLIFSPSKDKIDDIYAPLQVGFKIGDDEELNKYLVI